MQLQDKHIIFLGDSITEGSGASCYENCFVNIFQQLSKSIVYNFGKCGTRIAKQQAPYPIAEFDKNFIDRVDSMPNNADIIVVFGGTNDFGHGDAPLGCFEDRTENSFYGACHTLFSKLITKYPSAEIIILTPLHRVSEDDTKNVLDLPCAPLKKYVDAEKEVATYYSFPILDLWSISGLQPKHMANLNSYFSDDIHPNDNGHRRIANRLYNFLITL
jgi:lysophospholipase L1-like esterase